MSWKAQVCANYAALIFLLAPHAAHSGSFKTLHQFASGQDGANPMGEVTLLNGELYGTTSAGGMGGGVIFEIDPTTGVETVIHELQGDKDGGSPYAGLLAWHGQLYGTAISGGAYGGGSAFQVDPHTGDTTLLHSFGGDNGNDGDNPKAALIEYNGQLYGTTASGGGINEGTIFQIDPKSHAEFVNFYFQGGNSSGGNPVDRLLEKDGVLYGTASTSNGTLFSFDISTNRFTVLWHFSDAEHGINQPYAGLIANGGTFYGTAGNGRYLHGSVYEFKLDKGKLKREYAFQRQRHDGELPLSDLVLVNGTLYGTTSEGGKAGKGTIFGINIATKTETILHEFTGGQDGSDPVAGLIFYNGMLYGTASAGGANGFGTVFRVTP